MSARSRGERATGTPRARPTNTRRGTRAVVASICVLAVVVAGVLLVPVALTPVSAQTSTDIRVFRATKQRDGFVSFRLRNIDSRTIRRARVRAGTHRYRLHASTVRRGVRRDVLRIRLTRRMRAGLRREARLAGRGLSARAKTALRRPVLELLLGAAVSQPPKPPAEAPCEAGLGSFGVGRWPSACWRPYADTSPFNTPLPRDPRLASNSARLVQRLLGFGRIQNLTAGSAGTRDDYSTPVYYPDADDPLFRIHCVRYECPEVEGRLIRIPAQARPAAGGDAHLTTVDQASGTEYDLYDVENPGEPVGYGGLLTVGSAGRTSINGSGVQLSSSATAAKFGRLGGIIRAQELAAGSIDHALYMVARCDSGEYVYPAAKSGASCRSAGLPTADAPPLGTRFQLRMSDAEIQALPVPAWKKAIVTAMARYGLYFGDTGSGAWAIQAESGATYTSFGYEDRLVTFARSAPDAVTYEDRHVFKIADGIDWSRLRVIHPCVTRGTC